MDEGGERERMMKEGGKKRIAEAERDRDRDQFVPAKKFQTRRGSLVGICRQACLTTDRSLLILSDDMNLYLH